jgi:Cytosol aminopeptidase family, N-terminal domain
MKLKKFLPMAVVMLLVGLSPSARPEGEKQAVKEKSVDAPNGVTIKVRMEGPYDADTPLQIVCYFKHKKSGDKTLGAAVELDKKLGGVIVSLRNRAEFGGDELETLLLTPPKDTIKPKMLLLVGLGDEDSLSLERLQRIGKIALREAAKLGVKRAAFAPLLRDQGNAKLGTGDVEQAVTRGMLLAYDTEKRLQKEGLGKSFTLEEWAVEAGPDYFDDTVKGVQKGIEEAKAAAAKRPSDPYASGEK